MPDTAKNLFEDESLAGVEAAVDEAIRTAGGERGAVRLLLREVDQLYRALAWADKSSSLGYRRLRQPPRFVV
jgi:maltooligosyltrehalose synthase